MYTAMAARRRGVSVSLFAPKPVPMPAQLQPVADRLSQWLGTPVAPGELPRFEIAHDRGSTTYLSSSFGAESDLSPDSLPDDLSGYDIVHVVPLGDVRRQSGFIRASRARGARLISAGTFMDPVINAPEVVRQIIEESDITFMNRDEAAALFGSLSCARTGAGKLLFITLGPEGALVIQGECVTAVPSVSAREVDPTGAGDTFCGATLAGMILGQHPVMAARAGAPLAAEMIGHIGPTALFFEGPLPVLAAEPGLLSTRHA